jgi:hypothetical protein
MTRGRIAVGAGLAVLAAVAVVLVLTLGADEGTAGPPDPVTVSPVPGGRWASPATEISLRGLPLHRLGTIEVSGSKSGRHEGTLQPHFDGEGASFVPEEPFEPGEEVKVSTGLTIPGARDGDYRFWVSRPAEQPPPRTADRPGGPVQRFRSRPDLVVPQVRVVKRDPRVSAGHVFIAPKRGSGINGAMILDEAGELVWAREAPPNTEAFDFRVQRYRGQPVLTWWEGTSTLGVGYGEGVILDQDYREVMRVRAGNGYEADLHEFLITPRGTALLIVYPYVNADLTSVDGPKDGKAIDGVVQEIDLETGRVLFEWHSLDHVGLDEAYWPLPEDPAKEAWDYIHLNSVGIDTDGDLLVSARHTWAAYKIDRHTGTVRWRLGGKKSDFKLDEDAKFAYQHDVRRRADGAITLFDNAASQAEIEGKVSRGLALDLDEGARAASVADEYRHPEEWVAETQANMQLLPNGNVFVGWGAQPAFSEFTAAGELLFDGRIAKGNDNYRAYRGQWTGRPTTKPALVVDGDEAAVSWNGATGVARWQLLAGPRRSALRAVGEPRPRAGFETVLQVPAGAAYVAARALGPRGRALGESPPVEVGAGGD